MFFGNKQSLGIGLKPGDQHYRAYVGPPSDYDLVAAMVFNLLTSLGLRQYHKVLDIGCGSLRVGRLLIPYLNKGNFTGVEPNRWLVKEGIRKEVGKHLVKIKRPSFVHSETIDETLFQDKFDFVVAQSIFSHCGLDLIEGWLKAVSEVISEKGVFLATYLKTEEEDFEGNGWVYPGCVYFRPSTLTDLAEKYEFNFVGLDFAHPRQSWVALTRREFPHGLCKNGTVSWNRFLEANRN